MAYGRGHEALFRLFRDSGDLRALVSAIAESEDKKIPRAFQALFPSATHWVHQIFSDSNSARVFALREANRTLNDRPFTSFALMNAFCHTLSLQFDIAALLFQ
jgi:hypothetical protein